MAGARFQSEATALAEWFRVIAPGRPSKFVRRSELVEHVRSGAKYVGEDDNGRECYAYPRAMTDCSDSGRSSSTVRRVVADVSCRLYAYGQRIGNAWEFSS